MLKLLFYIALFSILIGIIDDGWEKVKKKNKIYILKFALKKLKKNK
jgi:hypothetical protein